jgi:hypothetical protein
MAWKKTVFEREKLFEEVWGQPMSKLAKTYGLSDSGLRKICVTLEIPIPPKGYWARDLAGREGKKPLLPVGLGKSTYELTRNEPVIDDTLEQRIANARATSKKGMNSGVDYLSPIDLTGLQAETQAIAKALKKARIKESVIGSSGEFWVDITVSEALVGRALGIADRAAFELVALGAEFENFHPIPPQLAKHERRDHAQKRNCFRLHGHGFFLRIRERIKEELVPENPSDRPNRAKTFRPPQYRHIPTGELQVAIVDVHGYYERYKIWDSSRGTIELKIRNSLGDAEACSLRFKLARELSAEREGLRREKAQSWEAAKENKNKLLSQLATFEAMAKDLDRARSLRRLIDEVKAANAAPMQLKESIEMMALMANWLDPLVKAPWPGVDNIGEKNPFGSAW